jgi:2-oxo-4-hydroxy-4-carboxy--5-ureidoimidazoline (OHCU) decarboxylase
MTETLPAERTSPSESVRKLAGAVTLGANGLAPKNLAELMEFAQAYKVELAMPYVIKLADRDAAQLIRAWRARDIRATANIVWDQLVRIERKLEKQP